MNKIDNEIWILAHSSNPEDRREWAVLYWKSKDLKHEEIADKWGYSKQWVQRYMTRTYKRFGAPKELNRIEKFDWLKKHIFPRLEKFIEGNPDTIKELPPPPDESQKNKDQKPASEKVKTEPKNIIPVKPLEIIPPIRKTNRWIRPLILFVVIALVGIVAYLLGRSDTSATLPTQIPVESPQTIVTPLLSPTLSPVPTNTLIPPTPLPTNTPEPTNTPAPTNTPKGYYEKGEVLYIKDGVSISLIEEFGYTGGPCGMQDPQMIIMFNIFNTSGSQFLLRWESLAFKAVDDLGNSYSIQGSGFSNHVSGDPILQQGMFDNGDSDKFCVVLNGQFPINAKSVFITIENFSGFGPFIFMKGIY